MYKVFTSPIKEVTSQNPDMLEQGNGVDWADVFFESERDMGSAGGGLSKKRFRKKTRSSWSSSSHKKTVKS